MSVRALIVAGLGCGVLGGAVAAVTIPGHRDAAAQAAAPARPALRTAPARPSSGTTAILRAEPGTLRVVARRADPDGGPPWAVRTFLGRRLTRRGGGRLLEVGRPLCGQLGREVGGRFGWVDGDNVFRPVGLTYADGVTVCGSRAAEEVVFDARTAVVDPNAPTARLGATVAFAVVPPEGRSARLQVGGRTLARSSGPLSAVLSVSRDPDSAISAEVTLGSGRTVRSASRAAVPFALPQRAGRPVPGAPVQADVRAPDPDGGPPYALAAQPRAGGGWCVSREVRLLDGVAGALDLDLGTFTRTRLGAYDCLQRSFPPGAPLSFGYGGGTGEGARRATATRRARRTQAGRFSISGTARPDVRSITIATPRDVRTVIPGRRAHAFLVVYDGFFEAGEITLTAHLRDGSEHVDRIRPPAF